MTLFRDPALGFILLGIGLAGLAALGQLESREGADAVGRDGLFVPEGDPLWPGVIRTRASRIPLSNLPRQETIVRTLETELEDKQTVKILSLRDTERVVSLDLSSSEIEKWLVSGRPAEPGAHEAVAGQFTRLDAFTFGGVEFTVVGRLKPDIAGLYFSYLVPWSESTEHEVDWTMGWYDPTGMPTLMDYVRDEDDFAGFEFLGGVTPAKPSVAWAILAGLAAVSLGGTITLIRLFTGLADRPCGPLKPGFKMIRDGGAGFLLMHLVFLSVFFVTMGIGISQPVWQMYFGNLVAHQFTAGDLAYVGEAYLSANIPLAAAVTFFNNYVLQTLGFTVLPSLVIPFVAIVKTAVTFAVAGFTLSPVWSELSMRFVYHSITIAVELEAYILATYAVCLYAVRAIRGLWREQFRVAIVDGLLVVGSVSILAGIILAVVALYEAATLILLG